MPDIVLPQDVPVGTEITVVSTGYKLERTKGDRRRFERTAPPVVVPPPVEPPPVEPPGTLVVAPGADIKGLMANGGVRKFALRGDATTPYRFSFGSVETGYRDVLFMAYPGDSPVIDGSGVESFVYVGAQSPTWKLTDLTIRNFLPEDQGVIGIRDSCHIEMTRVKMIGSGVPSGNNDHGVYFSGTGTGKLVDCDITGFPGAALQSYRGNPQSVVVEGGKLHGLYVGVFAYSGNMILTNVDIRGGGVWDMDRQLPATATLTGCTGRGSDGRPKVTVHS